MALWARTPALRTFSSSGVHGVVGQGGSRVAGDAPDGALYDARADVRAPYALRQLLHHDGRKLVGALFLT